MNDEPGAASVAVLGVRHHGPGSARAVRAALDETRPDALLIEGPADADPVLALAADPDLRPPVALLAYAVEEPGVAAFWPFAHFSPEWQALAWAHAHGVPVRFCDVPSTLTLAAVPDSGLDAVPAESPDPVPDAVRADPLAALAAAAGYDDPERWWDDVLESRRDGPSPFEAITEAMAELRSMTADLPPARQAVEDRREAHMRQVLRETLRGGARTVAVVCGAWHAPALRLPLPAATADARLLRGVPRRRTALAWVPWTHSRLAAASGYGAGVTSPGWYHHLFTAPDEPVVRWLTRVAATLREQDLPVSSAHVIEAVRLSETLAVLRGRPLAGLAEVTEATRAVLCDGDDALLDLVTDRLVVGEALGTVPATAPTVPLDADLRATAKRLRLAQDPAVRTLELDLRTGNDLARSHLLHRLTLLDVPWGVRARSATRTTGTFRETWQLQWAPELAVSVVEAALWGTTVVSAATAKVTDDVGAAGLGRLTHLVEACLLADLPEALDAAVTATGARAAVDLDVTHLMDALPALVRATRYRDVRGTDSTRLTVVATTMLVRVCAALPSAVTGLDDDAARDLHRRVDAVHAAVTVWDDQGVSARWLATVASLAERTDVNGLLTGRFTAILREAGRLEAGEVARRLALALSSGVPPAAKAAWIEGFLGTGGLLLVHDAALLGLIDAWVAALAERDFLDVLPLLRRTFGAFSVPERRTIGAALMQGTAPGASPQLDVDDELALPALRTAALLLGGAS